MNIGEKMDALVLKGQKEVFESVDASDMIMGIIGGLLC